MTFPLDSLNLLILSLDEKMDLHRFTPGKYVANGMQICFAPYLLGPRFLHFCDIFERRKFVHIHIFAFINQIVQTFIIY